MTIKYVTDYVSAYLNHGLKIIPLYQRSKKPIGKKWNDNWSKERVEKVFQQQPGCNIGLLLGDIVDVEGDSENANQFLIDLIGNIPHPCYISSKSIHHLFINPDSNLTRICCWKNNKIEFRANRVQSVLPPSLHTNGLTRYKWLENTSFPIPKMPDKLLSFYHNEITKRQKKKEKQRIVFGINHQSSLSAYDQKELNWTRWDYDVKPGHIKVVCPICKSIHFSHKKRYKKELLAFNKLGVLWSCHKCREVDVRNLCR